MALWGKVPFLPYPDSLDLSSTTTPKRTKAPVRVFIGQLPFNVTNAQVAWLCRTVGGVAEVQRVDHVRKRVHKCSTGRQHPTGCVHVTVAADDVAGLVAGLHERVLVDDVGVWRAETAEEAAALRAYVGELAAQRKAASGDAQTHLHRRPKDTVVVQLAAPRVR